MHSFIQNISVSVTKWLANTFYVNYKTQRLHNIFWGHMGFNWRFWI